MQTAPASRQDTNQSDRREFFRTDFQTSVTAIHVREDGEGKTTVDTFRAWSQDISPAGARLFTREPIDCERLFLKFLLPEIGDRFIEAEIVNEGEEVQKTFSGNVRRLPAYGVRFLRMVDDAEIEQLQQQAAAPEATGD
ncbi:PilZ domain protein [Maioricimonas rarisocia]|uniref:PilZ domain protein n=1 Tax=Maioricimonas rarisocia TaxID=2528026 RepID=A0A517ZBT7_9PLAN|nr:PilZ domain-containing protein [Maioricimonas rarisocia]QDU39900.1 PilZ domain protein [Maioricimonas rarisocia]